MPSWEKTSVTSIMQISAKKSTPHIRFIIGQGQTQSLIDLFLHSAQEFMQISENDKGRSFSTTSRHLVYVTSTSYRSSVNISSIFSRHPIDVLLTSYLHPV